MAVRPEGGCFGECSTAWADFLRYLNCSTMSQRLGESRYLFNVLLLFSNDRCRRNTSFGISILHDLAHGLRFRLLRGNLIEFALAGSEWEQACRKEQIQEWESCKSFHFFKFYVPNSPLYQSGRQNVTCSNRKNFRKPILYVLIYWLSIGYVNKKFCIFFLFSFWEGWKKALNEKWKFVLF